MLRAYRVRDATWVLQGLWAKLLEGVCGIGHRRRLVAHFLAEGPQPGVF